VDLDDEVGPFIHQRSMEQGYFCRPLSDYPVDLEVHFRPTHFHPLLNTLPGVELLAEVKSFPAAERKMSYLEEIRRADYRPHAVCTVQTFKNTQSGLAI
jgi:hypothetical protein